MIFEEKPHGKTGIVRKQMHPTPFVVLLNAFRRRDDHFTKIHDFLYLSIIKTWLSYALMSEPYL